MAYDKKNSGALFRNERKTPGDNQPDYQGVLDVDGVQVEISGWIREAKKTGKKFMSLAVSKKEGARQQEPVQDRGPF